MTAAAFGAEIAGAHLPGELGVSLTTFAAILGDVQATCSTQHTGPEF